MNKIDFRNPHPPEWNKYQWAWAFARHNKKVKELYNKKTQYFTQIEKALSAKAGKINLEGIQNNATNFVQLTNAACNDKTFSYLLDFYFSNTHAHYVDKDGNDLSDDPILGDNNRQKMQTKIMRLACVTGLVTAINPETVPDNIDENIWLLLNYAADPRIIDTYEKKELESLYECDGPAILFNKNKPLEDQLKFVETYLLKEGFLKKRELNECLTNEGKPIWPREKRESRLLWRFLAVFELYEKQGRPKEEIYTIAEKIKAPNENSTDSTGYGEENFKSDRRSANEYIEFKYKELLRTNIT